MDVPSQTIKEYWDSRAVLGPEAGTQDLIAKELEVRAIEGYVKDGMTILDAGCGNGATAILLAKKHKIEVIGVDFSEEMIELALAIPIDAESPGKAEFSRWDLTEDMPTFHRYFDLVYTQRAIINLPDWETQRKTIELLGSYLKPNGYYLMCECSESGLRQINRLRKQCGLASIPPPWHNRYIVDEEIEELWHSQHSLRLEWRYDFSGTYYFLSRVVNAWLARREGKEPDYNSPINQLALHLPSIDGFGQGKLWVWQRR